MVEGIFLIVLGVVGIVVGMTAESFNTGFIGSHGRPAPKWLGRTIFTLVGLWAVYCGWLRFRR
jgi:hypothetical protein